MAHNSLSSSQVDRLTTTASVVYLRPSGAARTTSSHTEEVAIPFTHVQRAHLAYMALQHGSWIFSNWKTPYLATCIYACCQLWGINNIPSAYRSSVINVVKEELYRHPSCRCRVTFHSPGQSQNFSPRLTFCALPETNSRMKYYTFPRRGNLTQRTSPLLSYTGGFLQTLYR